MNLPTTTKATAECGNCGSQSGRFLHHVRHRGIHRRLCTSCVLRLHPSSFCPICMLFYSVTSPIPQPSKRLTCSSCSSFTHSHCSPSPSPSATYLCPPCQNPTFKFFDLDKAKPNTNASNRAAIDKRLAGVLLCAAKIAAASMGKAVIVARAEAERRVREAAVARKRAREALEHVATLMGKEKVKRKEGSVEVEGSGNVGAKEKTCNPIVSAIVEKVVKVEISSEVSPSLRNVGAREEDRDHGFVGQNTVPGSMKNGVLQDRQNMDVGLQGNGNFNEKKSGNLASLENQNGDVQHLKNSHDGEEGNSLK